MKVLDKIKTYLAQSVQRWGGRQVILSGGGAKTHPNEFFLFGSLMGRQFQEYHNRNLNDIATWDHKSILKIIRQISPEASQAITTYLRIFDSGYTYTVRKANGDVHEQAKAVLTNLISKFEAPNGQTFEMPKKLRDLAQKFALDVIVKGAISGELVLNEDLRPVYPVYVDPWSIDFQWDPGTQRFIPRQIQGDGVAVLDIPTFFYIPVDPLGNDPYGEEQINSAIRAILFKIMVMQDLKQAIHTNAWKRLHISVLEEIIIKNAPPLIRSDEKKLADFVQSQLTAYRTEFAKLAPDDNFITTDTVEIKGVEAGNSGSRGILDPTPLLNAVDNQIANALKTFSVLLSKKFGGGSEGFTSSEMILYIKMIAGYQSIVEDIFERAFTMALRFMGIIASVEFKFKKPELRTDIELSQWRRVETENITVLFNEQAIGEKEKAQRLREISGFEGPVPEDIAKERIIGGPKPNEPERPSESEEGKERQRAETNRERRSGQND